MFYVQRNKTVINSRWLPRMEYTPEFKRMVIKFAKKYGSSDNRNGYSYSAICRLFKINRKTFDRWWKAEKQKEARACADMFNNFNRLMASVKSSRR